MYKKSKLLQQVLSSCEKNEGKKGNSASIFVAEVLKILAKGGRVGAESVEEMHNLEKIFADYNIDYADASAQIYGILDGKEEKFMDAFLLTRVIRDFELKYMNSEFEKIITVDDICRNILESPTETLKAVILKDRKNDVSADTIQDAFSALGNASERETGISDSLIEELRSLDGFDISEDAEAPSSAVEEKRPARASCLADIVQKADALRDVLSQNVYGQDHAVSAFVSGYFQAELSAMTEENRTKPKATFLFAGPPGVGKTFLSEQAAKALGLPFRRFDMSEYADKESNIEFCGSDKVYKNSAPGNVTSFVDENPECVLLFDEVEKCHLNVIHLFLQILDAGRIRDNYTDEEVSFTDAIIIFTTNAGKAMYEDEAINLLTVSRKSVLRALSADMNPNTGAPLFPPAICSRFASGSVIMFNRMGATHLLQISDGELKKQFGGISAKTGIDIQYDSMLPCALVYAEGGKADARTVKGKSDSFVFNELYELLRLMNSDNGDYGPDDLKSVKIEIQMPEDVKTSSLFINDKQAEILLFAEKGVCDKCLPLINGVTVHTAETFEEGKRILSKGGISIVLCDITCNTAGQADALNIEDIISEGRKFFEFVAGKTKVPAYILAPLNKKISKEESLSLSKSGSRGMLYAYGDKPLNEAVLEETDKTYRQARLSELARANRVLKYNTLQYFDKGSGEAKIVLFEFELVTAVDAEDADSIVDGISRPEVRFDDVIGARDAKDELAYFVDYLKNPAEFVRRGVQPPKGILLYGPPGTGKTLLAKAMAGESEVTFISAEGNQFLKRYVGEGPESVHELFRTARKYAPSVLFIDEIDAIAQDRNTARAAENTGDILTSFLTEMDGFKADKERPVFVLAATNFRVEPGQKGGLDPAILRRFDRRIFIGLPDKQERLQFINRKLAKAANNRVTKEQVENLAVRSTGASLADLESVIELALRNVIKSKEYVLTDDILEEAFEIFTSGEIKKWDSGSLLRTARHEAGHALVCRYGGEKPAYLTIVARGSHGGYMQHGDNEDKGVFTRKELISRIATSLGGRAAEVVCYGSEDGLSTGAGGDLQTATAIARSIICNYGMDEQAGLSTLDSADLAGDVGARVNERVNAILSEQFAAAKGIIENNRQLLDKLTDKLLEKNSLKQQEIEEILKDVK